MDRFFDFLPLLMGIPSGGEGGAAPGSGLFTLAPFAIIILIFYFLIFRPQSKKKKETREMLAALKKGDKVVTIGGVRGTVMSVKEETVLVRVDDNTKLEFNRGAISSVVTKEDGKKENLKQGDSETQQKPDKENKN